MVIPISFVWASLGESLEHIDSPSDALSGATLIALTALDMAGLAAILPRIIGSAKAASAQEAGRIDPEPTLFHPQPCGAAYFAGLTKSDRRAAAALAAIRGTASGASTNGRNDGVLEAASSAGVD